MQISETVAQCHLCQVIKESYDFKGVSFSQEDSILPSLAPRSLASGDIMYLICHMTLHDHIIEGSWKYMVGSSSKYVLTLVSLVNIGIIIVEI